MQTKTINKLFSLESEQSVLGALLLNNDAWDVVSEKLSADDFFDNRHRELFAAIAEMISENVPVDILTLAEKVGQEHFVYLAELAKNTPYTSNAGAYAEVVKSHSNDRELILVANEIIRSVDEGSEDRLNGAQKLLLDLGAKKASSISSAKDILKDVLDGLEKRFDLNGEMPGLSTGFSELDKLTNGLQSPDFIIIAARPSMGKTAFAMNIAENIVLNENKSVLFFSLEMSKTQIMERSLASVGRINSDIIKKAKIDDEQFQTSGMTAISKLSKAKLFIDDTGGLNINRLRSRALKAKREHGIDLILVDYLQLIDAKGENETLRIGAISSELKRLAKDLEVPVVALSQLSRALESRSNKRPTLSDLRQSGAIEQDADIVLMLYREEVYDNDAPKGVAELIITKHRNGEIGTVNLSFRGNQFRFSDFDGVLEQRPLATKKYKRFDHGFD